MNFLPYIIYSIVELERYIFYQIKPHKIMVDLLYFLRFFFLQLYHTLLLINKKDQIQSNLKFQNDII